MWRPVDADFYAERRPVEVVNLRGTGGEVAFVRSLLEELGAAVQLHLPGTPGDFLKVIGQGEAAAPWMVVCAHGDAGGIVFGEFIPKIDTSMLKDGVMPPECIAGNVDLPGVVVVNTCCSGGEPAMAEAFMRGGLKAYVGTAGPDPEGAAWPVFLAQFFYEVFHKGRTEREAWKRAASYDDDTRLFVCCDEEGRHEL